MKEPIITVWQATILDLDRVAPLFDLYRQFYRKPPDLDLARRFLRDRFEHNQSIIFLANHEDGTAVGFSQLFPSFSSASAARILILNDLFVAPEVRRRGVGSKLLSAAADFGRAIGAVRLTLSTEITNEPAQALYKRAEWKRETDVYVYNFRYEQRVYSACIAPGRALACLSSQTSGKHAKQSSAM
jgi:GNAT superfamily N-acetyltransferase